jgi:anthranilate phosphoribosyltransferase
MLKTLEKLYSQEQLTQEEARQLIGSFLSEEVDPVLMSAALIALKLKGETPDEITGAALAMIEKAKPFHTGDLKTLDTCGTGGDGHSTVNISTAAAIVAAEAGCAVVKHGNRSVSSKSGSADILEQLGLPLEISAETQKKCLAQAGICFLFAPHYHQAVKAVMPVRRTLKTRTVFNILGPLVNPARPAYQVLGVYRKELCMPVAGTLRQLGSERAIVVHGSGLDELALHGRSHLVILEHGQLREETIEPEQLGLTVTPIEALRGGSPGENAQWLRILLAGKASRAHRQAVALNAGAAIWMANRSKNLKEGLSTALNILESDRGWKRLNQWIEVARGS